MEAHTPYPVTLTIDYPDRDLDRASTLLRPLLVVPVAILFALVSGPTAHAGDSRIVFESGGVVFAATALMLAFRGKYPRWWFDWNAAVTRFGLRVAAYAGLLTDEYPSTDEEQSVHLEITYPNAAELSRGLPLVKWLLVFPHLVVLSLLCVGAVFVVLAAWPTILFTGRYPRSLFDYVVGVLRWWVRVAAYAVLLVTDRYPPFRLAA